MGWWGWKGWDEACSVGEGVLGEPVVGFRRGAVLNQRTTSVLVLTLGTVLSGSPVSVVACASLASRNRHNALPVCVQSMQAYQEVGR